VKKVTRVSSLFSDLIFSSLRDELCEASRDCGVAFAAEICYHKTASGGKNCPLTASAAGH
jgi:hypothetical protein